jgi:hypothetical protein
MKQFIPFSNGSEFMNWQENNCFKCDNYENESQSEQEAKCKLAFNLDLNFLVDGTISENIVNKIGFVTKESHRELANFCQLCAKCKMFNSEFIYQNPNQLSIF